jgi:AcrR family transcriptional regulator
MAARRKKASYHHGALREALLDVALRQVEHPAELSGRRLARELGVSHAAPAHHFPSKEALVSAVAVEGWRRFALVLRRAAARGTTPREQVVNVGRAYVRWALDHPGAFGLLLGRGATEPGEVQTAALDALRVLEDALASTAPGLVLMAWATVHGLATLWLEGPGRALYPSRAAFEQAVAEGLEALTARALG